MRQIKASRSGRFRSAAEELTYDLCAYAAADNTGDLLPIVPKSYCFSAEPAMLPPTPPAISWMIRPTTPPHILASSRCSPSSNVDWSETLGGPRYKERLTESSAARNQPAISGIALSRTRILVSVNIRHRESGANSPPRFR
jgi:hypothetical protein